MRIETGSFQTKPYRFCDFTSIRKLPLRIQEGTNRWGRFSDVKFVISGEMRDSLPDKNKILSSKKEYGIRTEDIYGIPIKVGKIHVVYVYKIVHFNRGKRILLEDAAYEAGTRNINYSILNKPTVSETRARKRETAIATLRPTHLTLGEITANPGQHVGKSIMLKDVYVGTELMGYSPKYTALAVVKYSDYIEQLKKDKSKEFLNRNTNVKYLLSPLMSKKLKAYVEKHKHTESELIIIPTELSLYLEKKAKTHIAIIHKIKFGTKSSFEVIQENE